MADRQTAIKSLLAVMDSTSRIQQEQNKIKMNMLENSQKFQNSFFESMMKNKMETQQKQEMVPFELEQKRQEKQMMNPLETEQLSQYKADPGRFSAPGKPINIQEKLTNKVATSGIESLNPNEKYVWGLMEKKISGKTAQSNPQTIKALNNLIAEGKTEEDFNLDLQDLISNRSQYEYRGVDVEGVIKQAMDYHGRNPSSSQSKGWIQKLGDVYNILTGK